MSQGILYLVGTPIGNLGDITYRAIETLKFVDFIVAEDTRVTIKLLNYYNIKNNLISYHQHSDLIKIQQIIDRILAGENCALVSDAGMPCISDPGEELVRLAKGCGIDVTVIPGPCAAVAGLAISGLKTSRFIFEGFLSVNRKNRLKTLRGLFEDRRTIIFYEAPHKLRSTLKDLFDIFGDRKISIIKEITKIHETVLTLTLQESINYFESEEKIKGEFVLILEGNKDIGDNLDISLDEAANMVCELHRNSDVSYSQAIKMIVEQTGHKKNELYKLVVDRINK